MVAVSRSKNMRLILSIFLFLCSAKAVCSLLCDAPTVLTSRSGSISRSTVVSPHDPEEWISVELSEEQRDRPLTFCYQIRVPRDQYVRLTVKRIEFRGMPCNEVFIRVYSDLGFRTFCSNSSPSTVEDFLFLGDVKIEASLRPKIESTPSYYPYSEESVVQPTSFVLSYSIESIACALQDHFRCSESQCVGKDLVCNGVQDCENAKDEDDCAKGVAAVVGVNSSRVDVANKIKSQMSAAFGWGESTPRAVLGLFLAGEAMFDASIGLVPEEELMKKELELKILLALLGNSTDTLPITELGIFVNALTVTCHNVRQFYGHDLLQILGNRVVNTLNPYPGASLALCNSNWTLPDATVRKLVRILEEDSEYPFIQDIQAMAVLALTCIQRKTGLDNITNATEAYESTIERFILSQNADGSFGNVYTTAIIAQALLGSGQESNTKWNISGTVKYLMQEVSQSADLLASYLVVPVLNNRTLLDVSNSHCYKTKNLAGNGAEDLVNKLGRKVHVQYSLYIGDKKDVVHTIYLRVPEKSSAYDVMRIAQANDDKYNFSSWYSTNNHVYVYSVAGIYNDPEALKFWLLYTTDSKGGEPALFTKSPDKLFVRGNQHLVMWFRTVPSLQDGGESESVSEETAQQGSKVESTEVKKEQEDRKNNSSVGDKDAELKPDTDISDRIGILGRRASPGRRVIVDLAK